ncbi:MAG: DUF58 domain-containing protein [Chromatiales bacterium]|jgi:uncharacterized protein (DUF58 family)
MSAPSPTSPPDPTAVDLAALIALRREARRLDIAPRGKVLATRSGGHLSRFRGRGVEFDESRVYQPGDDPRNMDWRVTARAGTPHVKLFREERERPVWLLVDLGPSMRFGTRVAFKSVIAARAAALLAWAAADKGDRVGGLVFDETRHFERRPAARTRGLLPLLNALSQDPIPGEQGGHPSLSAAAQHLVHLVRPGSLVFLLSDFLGLGRGDGAWLTRLGAGSEVVLVHIYDPLEAAAPPPGRYPVTDGVRRGLLDTTASGSREAWNRRFADHVSLLRDLSLAPPVHLVALRTDQAVGDTLSRGLRPRIGRAGGMR